VGHVGWSIPQQLVLWIVHSHAGAPGSVLHSTWSSQWLRSVGQVGQVTLPSAQAVSAVAQPAGVGQGWLVHPPAESAVALQYPGAAGNVLQ
jgi:hypothetical protein